jgi:hypothetical protein
MRRQFGRRGALGGVLLLAACATGMQSAPAAARSVSLVDMAGTWNMRTLNMAGDSVLVTYEIFSTGDLTGWTLTFPGRPPIPVRVIEVSGDSVVLDAGPYPSALRQDVTVSTRFDMQLRDDRLSGLITAIYNMPDGDVTVPLRVEGTRAGSATAPVSPGTVPRSRPLRSLTRLPPAVPGA